MRRSKLEMYADILKVLANRGPLITTHIMHKININSKALKEHIEFLIKQNLVEERYVKEKRILFEITPRGMLVLKGLKEIEKVFLPLDAHDKSEAARIRPLRHISVSGAPKH